MFARILFLNPMRVSVKRRLSDSYFKIMMALVDFYEVGEKSDQDIRVFLSDVGGNRTSGLGKWHVSPKFLI